MGRRAIARRDYKIAELHIAGGLSLSLSVCVCVGHQIIVADDVD